MVGAQLEHARARLLPFAGRSPAGRVDYLAHLCRRTGPHRSELTPPPGDSFGDCKPDAVLSEAPPKLQSAGSLPMASSRAILLISCPDRPGIIARVSNLLY